MGDESNVSHLQALAAAAEAMENKDAALDILASALIGVAAAYGVPRLAMDAHLKAFLSQLPDEEQGNGEYVMNAILMIISPFPPPDAISILANALCTAAIRCGVPSEGMVSGLMHIRTEMERRVAAMQARGSAN